MKIFERLKDWHDKRTILKCHLTIAHEMVKILNLPWWMHLCIWGELEENIDKHGSFRIVVHMLTEKMTTTVQLGDPEEVDT